MANSRLAQVKEIPKLSARELRQLKLEEQWSPFADSLIENIRLARTKALILKHLDLKGRLVADLGCGSGELSRFVRDQGAEVHAVDLSRPALKQLEGQSRIKTFADFIPRTTLEDYSYDLVICTDVIADLPEGDYRLLMNEMSRLVKNDGFVICSTEIDVESDESLPLFNHLANTEFVISEWVVSHHRLFRKLPFLKESNTWIRVAESISRNFYQEAGISHAIFIGTRKPLFA